MMSIAGMRRQLARLKKELDRRRGYGGILIVQPPPDELPTTPREFTADEEEATAGWLVIDILYDR